MKHVTITLSLILVFGICSGFAYTIPAFKDGGHYYSLVNNPNDQCNGFTSINTWSAIACIHMLFDYWSHIGNSKGIYDGGLEGKMYPQEEIAHVANINDVAGTHGSGCDIYCATLNCGTWGTLASDYVRAIHFSRGSSSADGTVSNGYSWQQTDSHRRGFTAIMFNFNTVPSEERFATLQSIINSNYPIIAFINNFARPMDASGSYPPPTFTWHAVLVIGYEQGGDDEEPLIEIHDPWFGPNKHYTADDFFANWNVYHGYPPQRQRLSIFGAKWNRKIAISFPDEVSVGDEFTVSVNVTYEADNLPINLEAYTVKDAAAGLSWTPKDGLAFASGEQYYKNLPGISYPGTSDDCSWRLIALKEGTYSFTVEAGGTISYSSYSYDSYTDEIGGVREVGYMNVLPLGDDDTDDDADDDIDDDNDTNDDDDDDNDDGGGGVGSSGKGCGGCGL